MKNSLSLLDDVRVELLHVDLWGISARNCARVNGRQINASKPSRVIFAVNLIASSVSEIQKIAKDLLGNEFPTASVDNRRWPGICLGPHQILIMLLYEEEPFLGWFLSLFD
ncbi:hypothetical protein VU04_05175 [Desulfobulbus sp. TB]|nr:hypothetical protein [Desulfobulbus sp. TB]